jgi:hypothetical protein
MEEEHQMEDIAKDCKSENSADDDLSKAIQVKIID